MSLTLRSLQPTGCSPHTIEPTLLQPFLDGTKEVILVCVQNGKTLPAILHVLHSSYLRRLVRLTMPLPSASQALPGWASVSLTLQLLGVVCNVSHTPSGRALHIRFLKRLPPEVDTLLWHLEGGFVD